MIEWYRVVKGENDYDGEILADFDTEAEAIAYADTQSGNINIIPILSDDEYWDKYPSRPCEL